MRRLRYFQINAFTGDGTRGNPAGVVPLDALLDDAVMLAIAAAVIGMLRMKKAALL